MFIITKPSIPIGASGESLTMVVCALLHVLYATDGFLCEPPVLMRSMSMTLWMSGRLSRTSLANLCLMRRPCLQAHKSISVT